MELGKQIGNKMGGLVYSYLRNSTYHSVYSKYRDAEWRPVWDFFNESVAISTNLRLWS